MNQSDRNSENSIKGVMLFAMLLFAFVAFNNIEHSGSHILNTASSITLVSENNDSGVLTSAANLPNYDHSWITADIETLKFKTSDFSEIHSKQSIISKFNLCTERYLSIKPATFKINSSFLYTTMEYIDAPAVS